MKSHHTDRDIVIVVLGVEQYFKYTFAFHLSQSLTHLFNSKSKHTSKRCTLLIKKKTLLKARLYTVYSVCCLNCCTDMEKRKLNLVPGILVEGYCEFIHTLRNNTYFLYKLL